MTAADPPARPPDARPAERNVAALCGARVRQHGHAPLLTYYDDATGERIELSYATFDNWASKTANLLVEDLDVASGDTVGLALRGHWTAAVVTAAAWKVGAAVAFLDPPAEDAPRALRPEVIVAHEDNAQRFADSPARLVVVGAGMGGRLTRDGVDGVAFGDEVLAFADDYDDPAVTRDAPALRHGATTRTQGELLDEAAGQLSASDRILTTRPFDAGSVVATLVAPLVAGASVVWCRNADPGALASRAAAERATPAP